MNDTYGVVDGKPIQAPEGWRILSEGSDIPQVHREYNGMAKLWCHPRRCHSTMTPFVAGVWGYAYAYAVPETEERRLRVIKQGV